MTTREFSLAPELRRASYIAIAGVSFCAVVVAAIGLAFKNENAARDALVILTVVFAVGAFLFWWVRHFRYRIDERGLHRRLFFRWQTWTWDTFGTGNVRRGQRRWSFVFPDLPLHRRKLSFAVIGEENAEWVLAECLKHWASLPPPAVPDRIELVPGAPLAQLFTSRRIYADARGLVLTSRTSSRVYGWRDVKRCLIFRQSHEHDGFIELRLEFPDESIVLVVDPKNDIKQWKGPKSDIVSEFIKQHVAPDCIVNASIAGAALSLLEVDARIERVQRIIAEYKKLVRLVIIVLLPLFCLLIWYIRPKRFSDPYTLWGFIAGSALLTILVTLQYGGTIYFVRKEFSESLADLHAQRRSFLDPDSTQEESIDEETR